MGQRGSRVAHLPKTVEQLDAELGALLPALGIGIVTKAR